MKAFLKVTTAAAALAGSAVFCAPANAAYIGVGVGPIGFDVYSGGYCDRWGCPNDYWSYPIYYGPVYYDNAWYRGPVYTRVVDGERWYWVRGAWHRDQWRGPRPAWARTTHYGPALGLDYYREHGFRVNDQDWRAWQDRDYRYRTQYRDYDRGGYYGNEEGYSDRSRDYDMTRDRYDYGRDRYQDRDMDQERGPDYDRERGTYEHSGYNDRDQSYGRGEYKGSENDRDQSYGRGEYNGSQNDRDQSYGRGEYNGADNNRDRGTDQHNGYEHSGYDRGRDTWQRNGYEHSGYNDRDKDRGMYQRSDYERSGGASGTGYMTHAHHTHTSHSSSHRTMQPSNRDENGGYQHTRYYDQGRMRPDDQTRDHGSSGASDQNRDRDRSGTENGYQHTNYQQQPGEHGHAKPPPVNSHSSQRTQTNPDEENNGPSD